MSDQAENEQGYFVHVTVLNGEARTKSIRRKNSDDLPECQQKPYGHIV